jgi:hypothetical protein
MQSKSEPAGNWPLRLSGVLGALFLENVLLGKASVLMGWNIISRQDK